MQSMQTLILSTPEEFCFSECLRYLGKSDYECLHKVEDHVFSKAARLGQDVVILKVSAIAEQHKLQVRYTSDGENPLIEVQVKAYLTDIFDLDTDLKPFYQFAAQDPLLQILIKKHFGLRLIGIPDLFEALCWAIIGQQINLSFAYQLKRKFVMQYGQTVKHAGQTFYLFPAPDLVAGLSVAELTPLQFSSRKAAYVVGIAQAMVRGDLSKEKLQPMQYHEAVETLTRFKGIGRWTANYAMLKCFRTPDAFPIDDVGLHHAIRRLTGMTQKPDLATIEKLSEEWKGWYAYITFYLWQSLLPHDTL